MTSESLLLHSFTYLFMQQTFWGPTVHQHGLGAGNRVLGWRNLPVAKFQYWWRDRKMNTRSGEIIPVDFNVTRHMKQGHDREGGWVEGWLPQTAFRGRDIWSDNCMVWRSQPYKNRRKCIKQKGKAVRKVPTWEPAWPGSDWDSKLVGKS